TTSAASCLDPRAQPFYVLDATGKVVNDPSTNKPVVAQLTGFIPNAYKGLGIDESGCIICHNGNRQATTQDGAHQNLVPNPFGVYDTARAAKDRRSTTRTGSAFSTTTTTTAASTWATPAKNTRARSCRPGECPSR